MAKILLVDDDPLVREAFLSVLESKGHAVVTAENGIQGLIKFSAGQFDLVITDIYMPDMEGLELLREIRRIAPDAKIVVVSGGSPSGTGDYLETALKFGAVAVMNKPVALAELYAVLSECLGEEKDRP